MIDEKDIFQILDYLTKKYNIKQFLEFLPRFHSSIKFQKILFTKPKMCNIVI